MSAGSGIRHSEYNASKTDPVNFLQVWVFPKERDIKPRYDQKTFDAKDRKNKWQIVVSPDEKDGAVWINQDARFALTELEAGKEIPYTPAFPGNGVYIFVIEGNVSVNGQALGKRDAIGVWETPSLSVTADQDSTLLAIEIPMV
jgi:hypothetical protein